MINKDMNPKGYKLTSDDLDPDKFQVGRRSFFVARDLQIAEATNADFGMVHAKVIDHAISTGWHYHPVSLQIIYVLKGWIDLVFEDGQKIRIHAGSCMNIPPGMIHNEIGTSDDMEVLEISSPAKITTVNVEAPVGLPAYAHA